MDNTEYYLLSTVWEATEYIFTPPLFLYGHGKIYSTFYFLPLLNMGLDNLKITPFHYLYFNKE